MANAAQNKRFQLLIVLILIGVVLMVFYNFDINIKEEIHLKRHIFFDLGANIGDSARFFFEIDNPDKGNALKGYAAKNNTKWEIYSFEANPVHNEKLDETKIYIEKNYGHKLNLFKETAAWIYNGNITFYLDTVNVQRNFWGASVIKEHPDPMKSNLTNIQVRSIDISELIKSFSLDDEIIVKVDIEGAEFKLLKHFIEQGTMKYIDIITVEFHFFNQQIGNDQMKQEFKTYCANNNVTYLPWYLGHDPFND